jgi:hypothetical protein
VVALLEKVLEEEELDGEVDVPETQNIMSSSQFKLIFRHSCNVSL